MLTVGRPVRYVLAARKEMQFGLARGCRAHLHHGTAG
jgi:hypothetical protein